MRLNFLLTILVAIFMSGCATIKPENIRYNGEKRIYEYKVDKRNSLSLRNEYQQLIDTNNFDQFKNELEAIKNRYPFSKRLENDNLLKRSDFELSTLYAAINQSILAGDYPKAIREANQLAKIYPDAYKFSDCYYLKGYAYEKSGLTDSAKILYGNFLKYSGQKFSSRFRGYREKDPNDREFIGERNYAAGYLLKQKDIHPTRFNIMKPKFYFGSFQPGYTLNSEDLARKSSGMLTVLFGMDLSNEMTSGIQYYHKLNERLNINPKFSYSQNMKEFSLATPFQVYRSDNNNFGIKFTPYLSYLSIDSLKIDDEKYPLKEGFFNFGARLSFGYYPVQNFAIGAYYQYNFYNESNKFQSSKTKIEIWLKNEYDVSLYYNIYKGFSLKTGVKNNDLVAGIFWSGWEVLYDISTPGLILRVDMY